MNEEEKTFEKTDEENMSDSPEGTENVSESEGAVDMPDSPEDTENIPGNEKVDGTSDSLEGEPVEGEESLYDKLVEDIAKELEESSLEEVEDAGNNVEINEEIPELSAIPQNPVMLYGLDTSGNDISRSDILDYLKEHEINTSLGMTFGEAKLSDLTVSDGLLLIILVLFLFRWLYDFGKNLF